MRLIPFVFLLIFSFLGMAQEQLDKDETLRQMEKAIPSTSPDDMDSLPEAEYRLYVENGIQFHYTNFIKEYAKEHDMDQSEFPPQVPDQIVYRIRAIPIEEMKKMNADKASRERGIERLNDQFRALLDKVREGEKLISIADKIAMESGPAENEGKENLEKLLAQEKEKEEEMPEVKTVAPKEDIPFYMDKKNLVYVLAGLLILLLTGYSIKKK